MTLCFSVVLNFSLKRKGGRNRGFITVYFSSLDGKRENYFYFQESE